MKTKLTIGERFALLGILPGEGNFATLRIVRKLRENISLTEDEMKDFGVKQIQSNGGSQLTWDVNKATIEKEFEFGEFAEELIRTKLKELNDKDKLENNHFTIYEKFVEDTKSKVDENGK